MASHATRVWIVFLGLITANVLGWTWALSSFADQPVLLGTALLAWVFGLRHAVDADHIAAIDNVVRAQMQPGRNTARSKTMLVGLYFSLGHSTVVVLASIAVAVAATAMQEPLEAAKDFIGVVCTAVSSGFLLAIALANLAMLRGIWRSFRRVRAGLKERSAEHPGAGVPCPVHRRDGAGGYRRQRVDGWRLWLGQYQTTTQTMVQPDDYRRLGDPRVADWRAASARPDRRPTSAGGRGMAGGGGAERKHGKFRLCRGGHFCAVLGRFGIGLSPDGL